MKKSEYKIAVIGLGYVGLLVALNFSKKYSTIGFDTNLIRIKELKNNFDRNQEVDKKTLEKAKIQFSSDFEELKNVNCYIIATPTPLTANKQPDLKFIKSASDTVAKYLNKGDLVVYESTLYPGVTEEILIPILEKVSGKKSGLDFYVGYSPERINPGDKKNRLATTRKIISGQNEKTLKIIANLYQSVLKADLYHAKSIKIAEASKLVENIQRDVNIAFANELSLIFDHFNIDAHDVLDAAKTKWNFMPFEPGLVGGHCINVSSYYLNYKSMLSKYHPQLICTSRKINESMSLFVVKKTLRKLKQLNKKIKDCRIGILGISYKENTAYVSDSVVNDVARQFIELGAKVLLHDPLVDSTIAKNDFGLELQSLDKFKKLDALIITIAHEAFKKMSPKTITNMLNSSAVIADLKGILDPTKFDQGNIILWRF
jgi:UDP-N-acetyl-D-galactosamine dehydrogenase